MKSYVVKEREDGSRFFDENTPTGQISEDTIGAGLKIDAEGKVVVDKDDLSSDFVKKTGDESIDGAKTFTTSPQVPTADAGDSSTKAANTAFVQGEIATAGADYVKKAGDTMTGTLTVQHLRSGVTNGQIDICNGTSAAAGGGIWLYGVDHANKGQVRLQAYGGATTGYSQLILSGDKQCVLNGVNIPAGDNSNKIATTQWVQNEFASRHVLNWLTKNTDFFVATNGSDTLDEGRGLTADKPFKTINACLQYVANNFNIGPYIAYIRVASGVYSDRFTIPSYNRTTGSMRVVGQSDYSTIIRTNSSGNRGDFNVVRVSDYAVLQYLKFEHTGSSHDASYTGSNIDRLVMSSNGGYVDLDRCYLKATQTTINYLGNIQFLTAIDGGKVRIGNGNVFEAANTSGQINRLYPFYGYPESRISVDMGQVPEARIPIRITGDYRTIITARGTAIEGFNPSITFATGTSITGKRYEATVGGTIAIGGEDPNALPGNSAGTVDASTYCWIK